MSLRCPDSPYIGIARLPKYRWIINARGYANIVETGNVADVVYGLVYTLTPHDEAQLDVNEGVPTCYTKETVVVDFWSSENGQKVEISAGSNNGSVKKELLVYIDRKRTKDALPKKEYVHRINMGVRDVVELGVPQSYVDGVVRNFIPAAEDESAKSLAEKQALKFEDEP
ncbi:MAG: hypothetical protein Q9183_006410 [Haloplaca sp. 2 TL-2023]